MEETLVTITEVDTDFVRYIATDGRRGRSGINWFQVETSETNS